MHEDMKRRGSSLVGVYPQNEYEASKVGSISFLSFCQI